MSDRDEVGDLAVRIVGDWQRAASDVPGLRSALESAGLLDLDACFSVEVARAVGRAGMTLATDVLGLEPRRAAPDLRLAAAFVGSGEACIAAGLDYAATREVFGRPLVKFPLQRNLFAGAMTDLTAALALARRAAHLGHAVDAAAAVPVAADAAWVAAETSLQVHGGYGYTVEFPVSGWWTAIARARAALPLEAFDDLIRQAASL